MALICGRPAGGRGGRGNRYVGGAAAGTEYEQPLALITALTTSLTSQGWSAVVAAEAVVAPESVIVGGVVVDYADDEGRESQVMQ